VKSFKNELKEQEESFENRLKQKKRKYTDILQQEYKSNKEQEINVESNVMKNEIISKIQYNTSNENKEIIMDDMGDEYDNLEIIEGNNIESLNENDTNNNEKEEENFLGPKKGFYFKGN